MPLDQGWDGNGPQLIPAKAQLLAPVERLAEVRERGADHGGRGAHADKRWRTASMRPTGLVQKCTL